MDEVVERVELDDVLEQLHGLIGTLRRGVITGCEATEAIVDTAIGFFRDGLGTHDELELVWNLGRDAVTEIAHHPEVMDPVLVEHYEEQMAGYLLGADLSARLDILLDSYRLRAGVDDPDVFEEVVDLGANGLVTHRLLLRLTSSVGRILRLAHELRFPQAIAAAVIPGPSNAHIADARRVPKDFCLALDLLAHLAAEPNTRTGANAIDLLLDVAAHDGHCAEAAARLPLHLLDKDHRTRLLAIHEARVEVYGETDGVYVPIGLRDLRANRIVRTALWQSHDVARV